MHFQISGTLILQNINITRRNQSGGIWVNNGSLTINDNSTFTINGGKIDGNLASSWGGGGGPGPSPEPSTEPEPGTPYDIKRILLGLSLAGLFLSSVVILKVFQKIKQSQKHEETNNCVLNNFQK